MAQQPEIYSWKFPPSAKELARRREANPVLAALANARGARKKAAFKARLALVPLGLMVVAFIFPSHVAGILGIGKPTLYRILLALVGVLTVLGIIQLYKPYFTVGERGNATLPLKASDLLTNPRYSRVLKDLWLAGVRGSDIVEAVFLEHILSRKSFLRTSLVLFLLSCFYPLYHIARWGFPQDLWILPVVVLLLGVYLTIFGISFMTLPAAYPRNVFELQSMHNLGKHRRKNQPKEQGKKIWKRELAIAWRMDAQILVRLGATLIASIVVIPLFGSSPLDPTAVLRTAIGGILGVPLMIAGVFRLVYTNPRDYQRWAHTMDELVDSFVLHRMERKAGRAGR